MNRTLISIWIVNLYVLSESMNLIISYKSKNEKDEYKVNNKYLIDHWSWLDWQSITLVSNPV